MSDTGYSQRTDLAVSTPASKSYGDAAKSRASQKIVPMGNPTPRPPLTPLGAPTERPNEPITAGAPFGAGPGSEALPVSMIPATGGRDDMALRLRAIASQFPSAAILGLLAELETPQ